MAPNVHAASEERPDEQHVAECAICQCACEEPERLECGHGFHASCLVRWLRQGTLTCPLCRLDLRRSPELQLGLDERARYLRAYARRARAPRALKEMVGRLRTAEEAQRAARRAWQSHRTAHNAAFRESGRLRMRLWQANARVRRCTGLLSVFDTEEVRLPAVVVHGHAPPQYV